MLKDYNGGIIQVLGESLVDVLCNNQRHKLTLTIVKEDKPALFGKDWLAVLI